jgi:hypothetical protein
MPLILLALLAFFIYVKKSPHHEACATSIYYEDHLAEARELYPDVKADELSVSGSNAAANILKRYNIQEPISDLKLEDHKIFMMWRPNSISANLVIAQNDGCVIMATTMSVAQISMLMQDLPETGPGI